MGNSFIVQCHDVEAAKDSTCCWEKIASHRTPHGSVFIASDQGMHGHEFDYQLPNVVPVTYKINTVLLICMHRASLSLLTLCDKTLIVFAIVCNNLSY